MSNSDNLGANAPGAPTAGPSAPQGPSSASPAEQTPKEALSAEVRPTPEGTPTTGDGVPTSLGGSASGAHQNESQTEAYPEPAYGAMQTVPEAGPPAPQEGANLHHQPITTLVSALNALKTHSFLSTQDLIAVDGLLQTFRQELGASMARRNAIGASTEPKALAGPKAFASD